jgi:hypothetical protein
MPQFLSKSIIRFYSSESKLFFEIISGGEFRFKIQRGMSLSLIMEINFYRLICHNISFISERGISTYYKLTPLLLRLGDFLAFNVLSRKDHACSKN